MKFPFIELKIGEWDITFTKGLFIKFSKLIFLKFGEVFCYREVRMVPNRGINENKNWVMRSDQSPVVYSSNSVEGNCSEAGI